MEPDDRKIDVPYLLRQARIREEYWPYKFEDIVFDDLSVKEDIKTFFENIPGAWSNGLGLYLYGDYGQGKTLISSVILKRALRWRYTGFFISFFDFVSNYGGFESQVKVFKRFMRTVDFLCIDDIGAESFKDKTYAFSLLDNVMVERRRPIIMTSNRSPQQVAEIYGDHLAQFIGTGKIKDLYVDSGECLRNRGDWKKQFEIRKQEVNW